MRSRLFRRSPFAWLALVALSCLQPARAADAGLPDGLYAEFSTPQGPIVAELYFQRAPLTVTSFVGLAEGTLAPREGKPFYTGLRWYRVVPDFVVQSGDPTFAPGRPDLPVDPGHPYTFPDEFVAGLHHDAAGVLSMANAGPDTNSSEFFLTLRATPRLNYLHSVFGRVVQGAERLPRIKPDESFTVKILRVGAAAQAFRADQAAFDALRAKTRSYAAVSSAKPEPGPAAHFDDPDKVLPTDPPRAKNFNFKLANFERATGVKIVARVFAKFSPATPAQRPGQAAASLVRELGLGDDGILAVYYADVDKWGLWIGSRHVSQFMGRSGTVADFTKDGTFHEAKQALLANARKQADIYTAEAEKSATPEKPVTSAQKAKYAVDAVLDALILKFEPQ